MDRELACDVSDPGSIPAVAKNIRMKAFYPLGYQVARKIKPVVVDGPPSKMVQSMEKKLLFIINILKIYSFIYP